MRIKRVKWKPQAEYSDVKRFNEWQESQGNAIVWNSYKMRSDDIWVTEIHYY